MKGHSPSVTLGWPGRPSGNKSSPLSLQSWIPDRSWQKSKEAKGEDTSSSPFLREEMTPPPHLPAAWQPPTLRSLQGSRPQAPTPSLCL